jgi:signal transduction histidine kinase
VYEILLTLPKKKIVTGFFILIVFFVNAQSNELDSLRESAAGKSTLEKYELFISMMQQYSKRHDYSNAYQLAREASALASSLGDSTKICRAGRSEGALLVRLDRPVEAGEVLQRVLPIAQRYKLEEDYEIILSNLGNAFIFQARYDDALRAHFEVLGIREKNEDWVGVVFSLNNIGLAYFKMKNYDRSLHFYLQALNLKEKTKFDGIERLLINIGLCYNQLRDFKEAYKYFDEAFKYCKLDCQTQIYIEGKFGLGVAQYGMNSLSKAKLLFQESLSLSEEIGNRRFQAENLIYLAHIHIAEQDLTKALAALRTCELIARDEKFVELLIVTYKEYANVYTISKEFQHASEFQQRYIHLKDSIYSERLIENIAKVQTEFAERENIKTIADNEAVIRQQRYLSIAIAIIAILASLLILVLQRSNRVSKMVNAQLSEAKEVISQQNKLLELRNRDLDRQVERKTVDLEKVNLSLKQVNDELDNFIYKTSHDIRGPLASLKGMCNVALMDVQDEVALDYLRKLDATAERLNAILTRLLIINQINNSKLSVSQIDFHRIVHDVILLEKKKGLPSKISIRKVVEDGTEVHSDKELVRIVLENLIDNAIKFYNDNERIQSFVEVNVVKVPEGVKVRVIDNGIGISESNPGKLFQMFFRASERSEIGGIGLYIVKTATAKIGGKVGLLTTPEGYTEFYVTLPTQPPSPDA